MGALDRPERSDCMNKEPNVKLFNSISIIVFVIAFALCAFFGWRDVVNNLFSPSADNLAEGLKMPVTYAIISFIFLAVLCCFVIVGTLIKSKTMLFIAGTYQLLFILGFVLLGVLSAGNITNKGLYDIVVYFLTAVLIPAYGAIWHLNLWFFLYLIVLLFVNVFGLIKAYKSK